MHVLHALLHDVTGQCMHLLHGLCCFDFVLDILLSPATLHVDMTIEASEKVIKSVFF